MLYVIFTQLEHSKIQKFEKIPFPEAVKLSHEIEMECRENKKELSSEFRILGENNEELYIGYPVFGSYHAPNLFIHIKRHLPVIKADKEKEKKRLALMSEMEELISDEYKQEEELEQDKFRNLDQSKISHLKKWQRRTIYGVGGFFALAFAGVSSFFFLQIASFNTDFTELKAEASNKEEVINHYETALLGDNEALKKYLATKEKELDTGEKQIYASYLANENEFDKLVGLYDDDPKLVASYLSDNKDIKVLKAFNEAYPTNEAKFDIAYADKNYNEVVAIENIEMTTDRSEKKTYAHLKTGKLEEAKKELENNNNKELAEKVNRYEELEKKITQLNEDIDNVKGDDDDAKKKRKKLEDQRNDLQKQQDEI
ncbi:hypothetical protein [Virgibacillus salexigens]|uniref:hypothetical protein n=1 Tax=Virgibacillus massiliensis TaxID=1462526 RepID=UPI001370C4D8|nr:hypothetical protein [Virgibacillus massiliensis]MYL43971.1 hypothetical protein [Virgibacillus massiliensis]